MPFKVVVPKYWRYIVVSLALLVGVALLSQEAFASNNWAQRSAVGAITGADTPTGAIADTDTDTDTPTDTPTNTSTNTPSPTRTTQLVVHVNWQGIPQPNSRNTTETITTTLQLVCGSPT